jgi:hypothetical protein
MEQAPPATPAAPGINVWGIFAWTILAIDALLAYGLSQMPRNQPSLDLIAAIVSMAGFFLLIGLAIAGVGCGLVSAAIAYRSADRRFVVVLPAIAHVALLLAFFGVSYRGQG